MINGYVVVPRWSCPINNQQTTTPIRLPAGCAQFQWSIVSAQPMRERSQFGCDLVSFVTDDRGTATVKADRWVSYPAANWQPEDVADGLPVAGHAVGSPAGVIPHDVGPFAYVVEESPAVYTIRQGPNADPQYTHALLQYTILGGNNGSPVQVAVVLEAFDEHGQPLAW